MDDKTWIDKPPLGYQDQQDPPPPPPPPLPPPPPPPERKFPRWIIWLLAGGFGIVFCGALGFFGYRLYQSGIFGLGGGTAPATQVMDDRALTQTALVESIEGALTEVVVASATLPPAATPVPTDTAAATEPPTQTAVPTSTLTPTPAVPTYTVSQGVFCRTGPSTIYPDVRTMEAGQSSQIFARSISPVDGVSVWYQVQVGGLLCFVSSGFGTVSGNLNEVPLIAAPPTPTPTRTPTATPTSTATPSPTP
jgi:hypothetical protein